MAKTQICFQRQFLLLCHNWGCFLVFHFNVAVIRILPSVKNGSMAERSRWGNVNALLIERRQMFLIFGNLFGQK